LQARLSDIGGTLAGVDKRQKACRLFGLVHGQPCEWLGEIKEHSQPSRSSQHGMRQRLPLAVFVKLSICMCAWSADASWGFTAYGVPQQGLEATVGSSLATMRVLEQKASAMQGSLQHITENEARAPWGAYMCAALKANKYRAWSLAPEVKPYLA